MNGPIFLAGVSGSGKTLLRLALSSHPRLAISRRTYMWTRFYQRYGNLRERGNFDRCLAAMLAHKPMWALNPDPDRIRREFWQGEPTYARLFALFHEHYAELLGRPRWGDQLGFVERYADLIFDAYPEARMIHMIRDPRDRYGASIAVPRRRMGAVGAATAGWLYSAGLAKRNRQRYPDRYKVVRYEALVSQLEETLRDICAFLDEDFVPGMLTMEGALRFGDGNENRPSGESASNAGVSALVLGYAEGGTHCHAERSEASPRGQRRSFAIAQDGSSLAQDDSSLARDGSYQDQFGQAPGEVPGAEISKREVAFIQALAGQDMVALGYEPKPMRLSLWERFLFYGVDWPVNLAGMLAWRALLATRLA